MRDGSRHRLSDKDESRRLRFMLDDESGAIHRRVRDLRAVDGPTAIAAAEQWWADVQRA